MAVESRVKFRFLTAPSIHSVSLDLFNGVALTQGTRTHIQLVFKRKCRFTGALAEGRPLGEPADAAQTTRVQISSHSDRQSSCICPGQVISIGSFVVYVHITTAYKSRKVNAIHYTIYRTVGYIKRRGMKPPVWRVFSRR